MKKYELLTVFKPNLDAEEVDKALAKIEKQLKGFGGELISLDKMGRRKLAYEVQKFRDGFFANQVLSIPADKVADFKRQLKLNDNLLRMMFVEAAKTKASK